MQFNWQAEDEAPFAEEGPGPDPAPPPRRWPWLLVIALLAIGGGFLLWREAEERAAEAEAAIAEQVRTSHALARRAAEAGDAELLTSLLSRRSEPWLAAQLAALPDGRLFAGVAQPLGLAPQGEEEVAEVQLDPDLRQAVLVAHQPYVISGTAGLSETVTLARSYVYRKGARHWLLSPPLAGFWGESRRQGGQWLAVTFPERNEALSRRLAGDLDEMVSAFCRQPGANCPAQTVLEVELATAPESVAGLDELEAAVDGEGRLLLPAPALIGRPLDEEGYQALLRGYATPLLARVLARASGYNCCHNSLFFSALLEAQMVHLGLASPLGAEGYEQVLAGAIGADTVRNLMRDENPRLPPARSGTRWQQALALVAFLEADLGAERVLVEGQNLYRLWLEEYGGHADEFVAAWVEFLYARSPAARQADAARPEGVIQFSCRASGSGDNYLWAYDFEQEAWRELIRATVPETSDPRRYGYASIQALPGGYGYTLREIAFQNPEDGDPVETGRIRWQPQASAEEALTLHQWERNPREQAQISYLVTHDPSGRYLTLSEYRYADSPARSGPQDVRLIDLEQCAESDCVGRLLPGSPIWAPGGERTLLVSMPAGDGDEALLPTIYLAGPAGEDARSVASGLSPFWMGDTRYGYLRADGWGEPVDVVLTAVDDANEAVVAETADFMEAIAADERPEALFLSSAWAVPGRPDKLVVRAQAVVPDWQRLAETFIFLLDLADSTAAGDEIRLLISSTRGPAVSTSRTGRWLLLYEFGSEIATQYLLDLEDGTMRPFGTGEAGVWSPDDRRLAEVHDSYFLVRRPDGGVDYLVTAPLSLCQPFQWVAGGAG